MEPRFFVVPYGGFRSSATAGRLAAATVVGVAVAQALAVGLLLLAVLSGLGSSFPGIDVILIAVGVPFRLATLYLGAVALWAWTRAVNRNLPAVGSGDPITGPHLFVSWFVPPMNVGAGFGILHEVWRRTATNDRDNDPLLLRTASGCLAGAFAVLLLGPRVLAFLRFEWAGAFVELVSAAMLLGSAAAVVLVIRELERRQRRRLAILADMSMRLDQFVSQPRPEGAPVPPPSPEVGWALVASARASAGPVDDIVVFCTDCGEPWLEDGDSCVRCGSVSDPVPAWELVG